MLWGNVGCFSRIFSKSRVTSVDSCDRVIVEVLDVKNIPDSFTVSLKYCLWLCFSVVEVWLQFEVMSVDV